MLVGARGWQPYTGSNQTFTDVPPGSTFYSFVEEAARRGIIHGYPCGGTNPETGIAEPCDAQNRKYFCYNNSVTRAQVFKMIDIAINPGAQDQPCW